MSSVLIKDIFGKERPMPQEGYIDVRLHFRGGRIECATMQTGTPPFYATLKVVEIPPHGRLIDIKSVEDGKFVNADNEYQKWWNDALESVVNYAPTIIEAEGREE